MVFCEGPKCLDEGPKNIPEKYPIDVEAVRIEMSKTRSLYTF